MSRLVVGTQLTSQLTTTVVEQEAGSYRFPLVSILLHFANFWLNSFYADTKLGRIRLGFSRGLTMAEFESSNSGFPAPPFLRGHRSGRTSALSPETSTPVSPYWGPHTSNQRD